MNVSLDRSEGSLLSEDALDTEDEALDTGDDLDVNIDELDTPDEADSVEFNRHGEANVVSKYITWTKRWTVTIKQAIART